MARKMDKNSDTDAAAAFWTFALTFYARPGIAPLCLRLQAEGGTDVMALIAHCHATARQDSPLSATELAALRDHMAEWRRRAVLPLRALRVDLRDPVAHLPDARRESFRDQLKQLELAAEKVQAGMIADWLARRNPADGGDFTQGLRLLAGPAALPDPDIALLREAAKPA